MLQLVLIVLLPKSDGGRRPIGLFMAVIRIWARARAAVARDWEARNARSTVYGGQGMGAQRASWLSGFRAEAAALSKQSFAQSLLDLVKAFEQVDHGTLIAAAVRHGYSLWVLRLSLASYRAPRAIGVDGIYTRQIVASRGITAGSTFATPELRCLLLSMVDEARARWPAVDLSLYVDDATTSAVGDMLDTAVAVAAATDFIVRKLEDELHLEVSVKKSVAAACTSSMARLVARASRTQKLTAVRAAKLLGAPSGGGRRRCVKPSRVRISVLKARTRRIAQLRSRSRVCIPKLVRAAATPLITYAVEVMGMSDAHLASARTAVARALAPTSGGSAADTSLYVADCAGSTIDPGFDAHVLPLKFWALAHWQTWIPHADLARAFYAAVRRLQSAKRSVWDLVTGPASALVASAWRLGWPLITPTRFVTEAGCCVDFVLDSPAAVANIAARSVRRWQFCRVAHGFPTLVPALADRGPGMGPPDARAEPPTDHPQCALAPPDLPALAARTVRLPQSVVDFGTTLGRVLGSRRPLRKLVPQLDFCHRPYLRSTLCGRQWTQLRVAQASRTPAETECQLCRQHTGTLLHRRYCSAIVPADGWPALPKAAEARLGTLDDPRRQLLLSRGFFAMRLPYSVRPVDGWLRWHSAIPGNYAGAGYWYVDGSLVDGPDRSTARCGFSMVLVDNAGDLLAYASGAPPSWVDSAAGAEAWAFAMVLRACPEVPRITTDCMAVRTTLAAGKASACGAARPLARIWGMVFDSLDGVALQTALDRLRWMPAHTTAGTAGRRKRSDGQRVTATDWRSNRLADALAKAAALSTRTPYPTRQLLHAGKQLVEHTASVIAVAAHGANNFTESCWTPAGKLVNATRRDSAPPPLRSGAWGPRPAAPHPPADANRNAEDNRPQNGTCQEQTDDHLKAKLDHAKAARARGSEVAKAEELTKERRFKETWLQDLDAKRLQPRTGPTAAERLSVLRERLALKARL